MILLDWSARPKTGVAKVPPKRKIPLESMSITLKERDASASFVTPDLTDIEINSWIMDDTEPGKDICWRVRSIDQVFGTGSHKVTLEHAINLLRDRIIWGEYKPAVIIDAVTNSSGSTATTCTAYQALKFIFGGQEDWVFDATKFEYGNVYGAYSFDGDTLYDAVETVSGTLDECEWLMDMSKYPFTFSIRRKLSGDASEMRAGRNLRTITKTVDRSGMYTRLFPVGYDDLQLSEERSKAAVEDINHPDRIRTYGVIEKSETNTSLDSKQTLNDWAMNKLHLNNEPTVTMSVEALELSEATGEPMDHFIRNRICRIPLPEFGGETIRARITELNFPDKIGRPKECKVTLSNSRTELTTILASISKTTSSNTRTAARTSKSLNETKNIVLDTVKGMRIKGPENNIYTLQYLLVRGDKDKESDWKDADPGNFSRAVDSWRVSVAGGAIRVTAEPQEQDKVVYVQAGTATRNGNIYTGPVQWRHSTDGGRTYTEWAATGKTFTVDATERYNQGWRDAYNAVDMPDEQTRQPYMEVIVPSYGVGQTSTYRYTVTVSNDYAYIINAANKTMARLSHSVFANGWRAANDTIEVPSENTSTDYMDIILPSSNVNQTVTYRYNVSVDDDYAYILNGVGTVVARRVNSTYNSAFAQGWRAANDALVMPEENTQYSFMDVVVPSSNVNQTASYRYGVSADNNYLYIKNGAGTTVARRSHTLYADGWRGANDVMEVPEENTATAYMDFVAAASTVNQTVSYRYTVSEDQNYVYIKNAVNTVVARTTNTQYAAGWRGANDVVDMPGGNTSTDYMDVVVPSSNVNQTSSYRYTVSADGTYAYIKNAVNTVVAQVKHNQYQTGWNAARASETQITMYRGAYDQQSQTYTCTCIVNGQIATGATFYLYAR